MENDKIDLKNTTPSPTEDPTSLSSSSVPKETDKTELEQSAASVNNAQTEKKNLVAEDVNPTVKPTRPKTKSVIIKTPKTFSVKKTNDVNSGRINEITFVDTDSDFDTLDPANRKDTIATDAFQRISTNIRIEGTKSLPDGLEVTFGTPNESGIYSRINQTPKKLYTGYVNNYASDSPLQRSTGFILQYKPKAVVLGGDFVRGIHDEAKGFVDSAIVYNRMNYATGALIPSSFNIVKKGIFLVHGVRLPKIGVADADYHSPIELGTATPPSIGDNFTGIGKSSIQAIDSYNKSALFEVIDLTTYLDEITSATAEVIEAATCVESRHSIGEAEAIAAKIFEAIGALRNDNLDVQNAFKYQEFYPVNGRSTIGTYRGAPYLSCKNETTNWFKHLQDIESSELIGALPVLALKDLRNAYKFWATLHGQKRETDANGNPIAPTYYRDVFLAQEVAKDGHHVPGLAQMASLYGSPHKYNTPAKMLYTIRELWKEIDDLVAMYSNNSLVAKLYENISVPKMAIEEILTSQIMGRIDGEEEVATNALAIAPDHLSILLPFDPNDFVECEKTPSGVFKQFVPRCYLRNLLSKDTIGNDAAYENCYHIPTWLHIFINAISSQSFRNSVLKDGYGIMVDSNGYFSTGLTVPMTIDRLSINWIYFVIAKAMKDKTKDILDSSNLDASVQLRYREVLKRYVPKEILDKRNVKISEFIGRVMKDENLVIPSNFDFHPNQLRQVTDQRLGDIKFKDSAAVMATYIQDLSVLATKDANTKVDFTFGDIVELNAQDAYGLDYDDRNTDAFYGTKDVLLTVNVNSRYKRVLVNAAGGGTFTKVTLADLNETFDETPISFLSTQLVLKDLERFQRKISAVADGGDIDLVGYENLPVDIMYGYDRHAFVKNADSIALIHYKSSGDSIDDIRSADDYQFPNAAKLTRYSYVESQIYVSTVHTREISDGNECSIATFIAPQLLHSYLSVSAYGVTATRANDLTSKIEISRNNNLMTRRMKVPTLYGYNRSIPAALGLRQYVSKLADSSNILVEPTKPLLSVVTHGSTPNINDFAGVETQNHSNYKIFSGTVSGYKPTYGYTYFGNTIVTTESERTYKDQINSTKFHSQMFTNFFLAPYFKRSAPVDHDFWPFIKPWLTFNQHRNFPFSKFTWGYSKLQRVQPYCLSEDEDKFVVDTLSPGLSMADFKKRVLYFEKYANIHLAEFITSYDTLPGFINASVADKKVAVVYSTHFDVFNPNLLYLRHFDDERIVYLGKPLDYINSNRTWTYTSVTEDPISISYYSKKFKA